MSLWFLSPQGHGGFTADTAMVWSRLSGIAGGLRDAGEGRGLAAGFAVLEISLVAGEGGDAWGDLDPEGVLMRGVGGLQVRAVAEGEVQAPA